MIFRDKIDDLRKVLEDIDLFYITKGITPTIYQSTLDNGYFVEVKDEFEKVGFNSWVKEQRFMVLSEENRIVPNDMLNVKRIEKWDDSFVQVFTEAEEPWEIEVAKNHLLTLTVLFW